MPHGHVTGQWMKRAIGLAALVALAGCATVQGATKKDASFAKYTKVYLLTFDDDPRDVLPKVQQHLERLGFDVRLADKDSPILGNQGTGVVLSPEGYVLTSAHVLGTAREATVWVDGAQHAADLVYTEYDPGDEPETDQKAKGRSVQELIDASLNSKENRSIEEELREKDLALLKLRSVDQPLLPASFAPDPDYRMGQDVYTIGFPLSGILGDKPRLNKGLLSATVGAKDNPNFVQMSAEIQPGNSGGPLLNEHGQVIGIVQMTLNPMKVWSQTGGNLPQNVNFAVKNTVIREFLDSAKAQAPLSLREGQIVPFDDVQHSVVQVHSGLVPEGFKEEPKLVCSVSYAYLWDVWFRFQMLDVVLYDLDTQEMLLRAGQYGDNPFSTEAGTLEHTFREIKAKVGR